MSTQREELAAIIVGHKVWLRRNGIRHCDTCGPTTKSGNDRLAEAIAPFIERVKAEALRDAADEIDCGVTFPVPPSVISALVRERADAIEKGNAR